MQNFYNCARPCLKTSNICKFEISQVKCFVIFTINMKVVTEVQLLHYVPLKPNCSDMISINRNNISGAMMSLYIVHDYCVILFDITSLICMDGISQN